LPDRPISLETKTEMTFTEKYNKLLKEMKELKIPFPQHELEYKEYCKHVFTSLQNKKATYVEIGSRHGGSLFMAANFLKKGSKVISIELPNALWGFAGTEIKLEEVITRLNASGYICHSIIGNSQEKETKEKLFKILQDDKIDILFIDGDHTFEGVNSDWNMYIEFVKQGGMIGFHDVIPFSELPKVEVWKLFDELKRKYPYCEIVFQYGIGIIFKREK